jgi:hypothetical protein
MPTFELVNPYIIGGMKKTFNASSSNDAADEAWSNLSKYITNNIPKFAFTIKKISDGKLYHYVVKEKIAKNKTVNYSIKELSVKLSKDEENNFLKHISKLETQLGGKKKEDKEDDSDSDSDSNSESSSDSDDDDLIKRVRYFKNKNQPLNYLWYSPVIYNKDGTLTSVYLPSFTYPIVPYLELSLSSLVFKLP